MSAAGGRLLVVNGVLQASEAPPISAFLEGMPGGAYTTTRTHGGASVVLFWERHLRRLARSARILAEARADGAFVSRFLEPPSRFRQLIDDSLRVGMLSMKARGDEGGGEELAITTLVRGWGEVEACVRGLDVYIHIGFHAPLVFGTGARLAVAGRGRETAEAKSTEWVRIRKHMEKLRPPLTTELLLSNDGDRILEGSVTNFFVVCRRKVTDTDSGESLSGPDDRYPVQVQTAPVSDGVLPGVIRQLVIEICSKKGIAFQEVAPSWAERELWEEAFITNSLRLLQHVEVIQAPTSCQELDLKTWRQVLWVEKQFKGLGIITTEIQRAILEQACIDGFPISSLL